MTTMTCLTCQALATNPNWESNRNHGATLTDETAYWTMHYRGIMFVSFMDTTNKNGTRLLRLCTQLKRESVKSFETPSEALQYLYKKTQQIDVEIFQSERRQEEYRTFAQAESAMLKATAAGHGFTQDPDDETVFITPEGWKISVGTGTTKEGNHYCYVSTMFGSRYESEEFKLTVKQAYDIIKQLKGV